MAKFKIGDRVIVTSTPPNWHCDVGQVGTVLDSNIVPWIEFDTPTRFRQPINVFPKAKTGFCGWVSEERLELYHDEPLVPKPQDEDATEGENAAVHAPAHYQKGGIETIRFIAAKLGPEGFKSYCIGNVYKYLSRHEDKGGKEDLDKAGVYLNWATNGLPEG